MGDRYECIQEPSDSWLVWDILKDEPAVAGDRLLMGLTAAEAYWLCYSLNIGVRETEEGRRLVSGTFEHGS